MPLDYIAPVMTSGLLQSANIVLLGSADTSTVQMMIVISY